jgi:hypothetical protein
MTISQKVDHTRLGAKGYSEKTEFECREKVWSTSVPMIVVSMDTA